MEREPILQQLETTSAAVAAAHDFHVEQAMEKVRWERRGFLRRLIIEGLTAAADDLYNQARRRLDPTKPGSTG
jgi:hypothetical protein